MYGKEALQTELIQTAAPRYSEQGKNGIARAPFIRRGLRIF